MNEVTKEVKCWIITTEPIEFFNKCIDSRRLQCPYCGKKFSMNNINKCTKHCPECGKEVSNEHVVW